MKRNILLLNGLFLLIFVASCSPAKQQVLLPELEHVEAIMYAHPDSALQILQQMELPKSSDRLNRATWALLLLQAENRSSITRQSDSLIRFASDYFMQQDNPQRKALALYLEGSWCGKSGDNETALQFYLKAADEVDKTDDHKLAHLIYAGQGFIYNRNNLFDQAEEAAMKSYDHASLSDNNVLIANSELLIGRLYASQKKWSEAEEHYSHAVAVLDSSGNSRLASRVTAEMAQVYRTREELPKALACIQREVRQQTENDPDHYQHLLKIANLFTTMSEIDSATHYYRRAFSTPNLKIRRGAYWGISLALLSANRNVESYNYLRKYSACNDSVQKLERTSAILEIQEKYNQEKLTNEKNQLQIERDQAYRTGLFVVIALLCIILVLIYAYQRRLIQKERMLQKNEEQLRLYTLQIHENEVLISQNNGRISELTAEMEQSQEMQEQLEEQQNAIAEIRLKNDLLHQENEKLQQNIRHYSSSLQEKSKELDALNVLSEENLRLQERERFLSYQLFKKTTVLNNLKSNPKYLSPERWEEVKEAIDWLYDGYTKRLSSDFPSLTESDLQICYLMKLNLSISEIAILLGISPASVSKRKLRLKERMLQESVALTHRRNGQEFWAWEH